MPETGSVFQSPWDERSFQTRAYKRNPFKTMWDRETPSSNFSYNPSTANAQMPSQDLDYGSGSYDDGGYGAWADAGADYGTNYDATTDRVQNAMVDSAYKAAVPAGIGYLGTQIMGSYLGAPSGAIQDAAQGAALSSAFGAVPSMMGNIVSSAYGIDRSAFSDAVGTGLSMLGKMANPALGALGTIAGPVVGEGLGKVFGIRTDENFKQNIENTLGTGFMETARTRRDIKDYANQFGSIKADVMTNPDGTVESMALSPREQALVDRQRAAYGAEMSNRGEESGYNSMLAGLADDYGLGPEYANFDNPVPSTVQAYQDAVAAQPGYNASWSGNEDSINNPRGFNAAGYDTSGLSAQQRDQAVRDYNQATISGQMAGGDIGRALSQMHYSNIGNQIASLTSGGGVTGSYGSNFNAGDRGWSVGPGRSNMGSDSDGGDSNNGGLGSSFSGLGGLSGYSSGGSSDGGSNSGGTSASRGGSAGGSNSSHGL